MCGMEKFNTKRKFGILGVLKRSVYESVPHKNTFHNLNFINKTLLNQVILIVKIFRNVSVLNTLMARVT